MLVQSGDESKTRAQHVRNKCSFFMPRVDQSQALQKNAKLNLSAILKEEIGIPPLNLVIIE